MALSRISGKEDLYVGSVFSLRRASALQEHKITHVLSVIRYSLADIDASGDQYVHLSIDIDDLEDQDIFVHLPRMVRFIERGLYGDDTEGDDTEGKKPGAVLVHCAMGKSRSVTAVVAWLLWKYPHRFGGDRKRETPNKGPEAETRARAEAAVDRAVEWVRESRAGVDPNEGFRQQLALWWEMGCPADTDDAVAKHRTYRRWAYRREVEESVTIGRAPDRLQFEDEELGEGEGQRDEKKARLKLRCKMCRRVLATEPFVIPHNGSGADGQGTMPCPHFFVEPLSWMRPVLEQGALEGRLTCPNAKCAASVGRYAWQGFKCSCGEWVCPALSLQRSKVDGVAVAPRTTASDDDSARRMAALGIRLPPGQNL